MKRTARKLKLSRETLRNLIEQRLRDIAGGNAGFVAYSVQDTNCTGCEDSPLCAPTFQRGCELTT